jgi:hypothetical protein
MNRRIHYHPRTERRIISAVLYFVAACALVIVLTSCSPYAVDYSQAGNNTPTAAPSMTATVSATPTPLPAWWMYSAGALLRPAQVDGRKGYK